MQADCFAQYLRDMQKNATAALADDLAVTATLLTCMNAHLYGSLGEHLVERSGEADITGKAFLEVKMVVQILERHTEAVQSYANRARSLGSATSARDQVGLQELGRDLDNFAQMALQDLQQRHHSD